MTGIRFDPPRSDREVRRDEFAWRHRWRMRIPDARRVVRTRTPDGCIPTLDLRTPSGAVVTFHEPEISSAQRQAHEALFENLVWIVDGRQVHRRFHLGRILPKPTDDRFQDIVWFFEDELDAYLYSDEPLHKRVPSFWRISELRCKYPDLTKANWRRVLEDGTRLLRHPGSEVEEAVKDAYVGHHQCLWGSREPWLQASCPVFLDFGDEQLYSLRTYGDTPYPCVLLVSTRRIVSWLTSESAK